MGLIFGILKKLIKLAIYFSIVVSIIAFLPNLPPYTKFSSISLEAPQPRVGPLATNEVLNKAEKLYINKLLGPEAFEVYKGELYTSLATGEIVKTSPSGHVTFVTKLGQPCTGLLQEHICGRPLGFKIDGKSNVMYVADAYLGLWKVDLTNDKKQLLVSPRVAIEGRIPKLINSVELSKNGDLYWTDSSSDFHLKDGAMVALSDPSGRLFQYNSAKNQSKVLLDDLWFSNGVAISPDNQFVVVAETLRLRLLKYYIDGPNKGKSEVLVAGLPGFPDNVRALPDGSGMLVGLYVTYDDENPLLAYSLAETPLVRKILARVHRLIEIPFEYLNNLYPHVIFEDIVYFVGHFKSISGTMPQQSGLVVVDWNGNIIESYYNTDGSLGHISDAIVYNNKLHTGCPHLQNFIGSVPVPPLLKKAFESKVGTAAPKKQPKPVETAPKQEPKPVKTAPKQQPKPVETAPKQQPKPVETAPKQEPKPVKTAPKQQPKPVETAPKQEPKPVKTAPKQQPKPVETAPKQQPKPVAAANPKVEEKPKVEAKRDAQKPVVQEKPAPQKQAKPVEAVKPPPPPSAQKPAPPQTVEPPKPAQQKPVLVPEKPEPKAPTPSKQERPTPTPKKATSTPEAKAPPTPKETPKPTTQTPPLKKTPEIKTTTQPKAKQTEPEQEFEMPIITRPKEEALNELKNKLAPENIPISEEIQSDTAKPSKDTLKVIKKDGPAEIPNPHLK